MTDHDIRDTLIRDIITDAPHIISVKRSDSIAKALKTLLEKDITALGVFDDEGDCFIGLVTAFDIMTYVCLGAYKEDATPDKLEASKKIDSTPIGDVTGVFHDETKRVWNFDEDLPIVRLLEPMSKGVHRAVINMADESFKLISQHDVVKFGLKNSEAFSDTLLTLEELGLGNPSISHVCTVTSTQPALYAFRKMEMLNHTALPIVDYESGSIIATISSSDIRFVAPDNMDEVLKPSLNFLNDVYSNNIQKPLTCTRNQKLSSIMEMLLNGHHKHVWVVDDENRPISAVSLSDIINRMQGINEDLQSRALAVYGRKTMKQLFSTKVLISGINGLGAEIAKNVILANVNSVTLHDTKNTSPSDLNSHFYLSEEDIGKNRASSCLSKLAELNPSVRVTSSNVEKLSDDIISQHNIVVLIETSNEEGIRINNFCRNNKISFIKTDIKGLAGYIFCDFGNNFEVIDVNGEQPQIAIVQDITSEGRVQCVNDEMLNLQDGDIVSFTEVEGMIELNNGEYTIERVTPYSFSIKDFQSNNFGEYKTGGIVTQIKKSKIINFKSFEDGLKECDMIEPPDYSKFDRHYILHSAFKALDSFEKLNGRSPRPANLEDAEEIIKIWNEFNENSEYKADLDSNKKVLTQFSHGSSVVINPMAASFGGIVGQEVIKAATGKFHPINQWFYLDAFEALPDELLDSSEYEPKNCRYDAQIQLFGKTFQEKLSNLKYFLVGSGALGCEYLKNFAMTGIACGPNGLITVTDDDVIEKSNLSRQFLFRNWHIHKSKSLCASDSAREMNPNIKIIAKQDRVSTTTENVFNDEFWEGLDGVCNALDNIKARLYVDSRCIFYEKPLLESGTLGTKCNSQVIIPHKTRHYGDQPDQPEKQAPVCVLHHFPHNIQHCLTWGRSEFNGNFEIAPSEVNKYIQEDDYVKSLKDAQIAEGDIKEKLEVISKVLKMPCKTYEDCVKWARLEFEENFSNKVKELIFNLPKDAKTSTGTPFWSPPKRFPTPLEFDENDTEHMRYIMAGANLKASTFKIQRPKQHRKEEFLKSILKNVKVPEFVPKSKKIKTDENDQSSNSNNGGDDENFTIEDIQKQIPSKDELSSLKMQPEDFEKDDDTNFHMDYIGAAANLRARCYKIEEVDKLKAKLIAGRIIPAIATATALATGFIMLELFKLVNERPMGDFATTGAYRCSSNNLALPQFSFFEPLTPIEIVDHVEKTIPDPMNHPEYEEEEDVIAYPPKHTIWDKLHVKIGNDFTMRELIEHFKKEHELTVDMITVVSPTGKAILTYGSYNKHTHDRLDTKFSELVFERTGEKFSEKKYYIPEILFSKDGDTVVNPPVVIHLN